MRTATWREASDGSLYRDLNGNGVMDPYEDQRLSVDARTEDLLARLSLVEKVGLMFITVANPDPAADDLVDDTGRPGRRDTRALLSAHVNHLNVHHLGSAIDAARWTNELQYLAETTTPHGIPVTVSTDPRHAFQENDGVSLRTPFFSTWPEPLGLAALGDLDVIRDFGAIARSEYRAIGLTAALHPSLDLATEPRWARQYGTFGSDAEFVARACGAYLDGFEGETLGPDSVSCTIKHFPGGGPQKDGEDPHFPYGREQVYPGGDFETHLAPFRALVERGVSGIMAYYGMPVGLSRRGRPVEEVGFGFHQEMITGILRGELGYDGVVLTDWGLVTDSEVAGKRLPARAWGLETASRRERVRRILEAGCDQLGGEECVDLIVELVERGEVPESRIDESARRILRVKFALGLFDDPYVDEAGVDERVGTSAARAAGQRAQARSLTMLTAPHPLPPLRPGTRVFAPTLQASVLTDRGLVPSDDPTGSDLAIIRLDAPYEPRDEFFLESSFHAGSLDFAPETLREVADIASATATAVVVHLDRPAILTPLVESQVTLLVAFGASDEAVVQVLAGEEEAVGRLPFDIPRSMDAVRASPSDRPGVDDQLFPRGSGRIARRSGHAGG
ncbi:glycoside hydrolase family 3 N-terminal domain-containing protein [Microbacterium sp. 5K110]|jgi:beta-glucosidase|uniref:glycoside hydrolase family 3 protein n=1 Tax=unclassified Microbacterium TaxID=2609290 RepID=UPI0010FCE3C7|nr:glycoside hydrolase family 3 N-terminal domain-containing protein [Microbacterium sp. 5K110]TLF31374.1 glycoside hydrolase family 3 protein [Microbacterium sp. 5K110]